jgi:serine/threonine-protein kinase RsbT
MVVELETDRFWAAGEAERFALELGLGPEASARFALCVAELCSNAVRHAGQGRIELFAPSEPRAGVGVRVEDRGPGIAEFEEASRDGFSQGRLLTPEMPPSERRSLGVGLGAVRRLMSEVRVWRREGGGAVIEAVLWRKPRPAGSGEV